MARKPKPTTVGTKTYILELKNGNVRRMTIPDNWSLTFGQLVPHTLRDTSGRTSQVALRIYGTSKQDLRSVMTDVVAVRDESISIVERRTTVQRKASQKQTAKGAKDVVIEARVTEWVDPDAEDDDDSVPSEFLRISNNKSDDF